jgi:hypothetical protein
MDDFLHEEQIEYLRCLRNADRILVALCLEPNVDLFEAFASPYFSGKKTSSTNRREKQLARREIFHQMATAGNRTKSVRPITTNRRVDAQYSYLQFANHLRHYSSRWREASFEEVLSLVVLLDQEMKGHIDEQTIFDFCGDIDNTRAMDRQNPHRIIQTLLIHMIDRFHERSGTALCRKDVKEGFQALTYHLRHKRHPPVPILANYFQLKDSKGNDDDADMVSDFWLKVFGSCQADKAATVPPASPPKAVGSLLQTLSEFREQSAIIAEEIRQSEDQVVASQKLWQRLQEMEDSLKLAKLSLEGQLQGQETAQPQDLPSEPSSIAFTSVTEESTKVANSPVTKPVQQPTVPTSAKLSIDDLKTGSRPTTAPLSASASQGRSPLVSGGRSPLRRASSVGRMAFTSGRSLLSPGEVRHEIQDDSLKAVSGNRLSASTSYLLRAQSEQLALKHGLSTKVPLVREKKPANPSIIRHPHHHQSNGNRNVFDPVLFTWVPTKKPAKKPDERFMTPKEMQLEREKTHLLYH